MEMRGKKDCSTGNSAWVLQGICEFVEGNKTLKLLKTTKGIRNWENEDKKTKKKNKKKPL